MSKQIFTKNDLVILYNAVSGWALKLGDDADKNQPLKNLIKKIETMIEEA